MKTMLLALTALTTVAVAAPASAATIFTDRASFNAAVPTSTTETFANTGGSGSTVTTAGFTVTGVSPGYRTGYYDRPAIGTYPGANAVVFNFNNAITSFGTDILGFGTYLPATLVATLSNGETFNLLSATSRELPSTFRGFTASSAFTSVSFTETGNQNASLDYVEFDNVTSATGAVPEPATWALMILGMGAVGFAMRRRNKVTATLRFA